MDYPLSPSVGVLIASTKVIYYRLAFSPICLLGYVLYFSLIKFSKPENVESFVIII